MEIDANLLPRPRRLKVQLRDSRIEFSVPGGVSEAAALEEIFHIEEWVLKGYAKPMRSVDTPRGWRERNLQSLWNVWATLGMWARVAWRATVKRRETAARIGELREAIDAAVATAEPLPISSGNVGETPVHDGKTWRWE